jgi:adenylosuccinate lyase
MDLNLEAKLSPDERAVMAFRMSCISPDDAKYGAESEPLATYLSAGAEWHACAHVQRVLLETRVEFGQAQEHHVDEVSRALSKISPINMALLEKSKEIQHDQLAVIAEIGRFVSPETKALLHPGTTSYDILDTARSWLLKRAWATVSRPAVIKPIDRLCMLAEKFIAEDARRAASGTGMPYLQVGRTHLQNTSPVPFGVTLAGYAARLADRVERLDSDFARLKGKISGIVGTGASVEMVVGEGRSMEFERAVLKKLGLEPDYAATQIVQKERLADIGHGLATLAHVIEDFSNDMRLLYSSAIREVTSRDNAARLGGSSADALKNNPINYENICGKAAVIESGMRVLYAMIQSDFHRDLRNSVQGRYQPQQMMVEVYESCVRLDKALSQLSVNEDRMSSNLQEVRDNPSEAMVAILRGEQWLHSTYGVGHDFVKEIGKRKGAKPLLPAALEDREFKELYERLPQAKKDILRGKLESYLGSSIERAEHNIAYARSIMNK